MAKSQQVRSEAEHLFVRRGKTLEEIAAGASVSKTTLARWSKSGNWLRKREEYQRESPTHALDKLKEQRKKIIAKMTGDVDLGLIDGLQKVSNVIESMEKKLEGLGPVLDVMERFARFVATSCDDETAALVRHVTEGFLAEVRREHV